MLITERPMILKREVNAIARGEARNSPLGYRDRRFIGPISAPLSPSGRNLGMRHQQPSPRQHQHQIGQIKQGQELLAVLGQPPVPSLPVLE